MADLPTGTVTFLFTDVEGHTRLWEQHPDATRAALAREDALVASLVAAHGGVVVRARGEGDSHFAVFARASDAAAAAAALQRALHAEPWPTPTPMRLRLALHTGEADLREGSYYGLAVNRCARLRAIAHGGQTLLSQTTRDLVHRALPAGASLRDLGEHRLRDFATPERVYQLAGPGLPAEFPPLASPDALTNNLPRQLTSFVGRERELAEVKRLLATSPLVTLTGAGGCGKTRLALQVAVGLLDAYPDGVWFVDLAPLADPALVPEAVATALGLRETAGRPVPASLTDYLRTRALLLLLDNCEHLVEPGARLVDTLLRTCPALRILATSREPLGVPGEVDWRVPPLTVPDPRQPLSVDRLADFEAVRLFVERARLVVPTFALTDQNAHDVAEVCSRLDGIPLAIELAAARARVLTPQEIAARLDDRFHLLTGGSRTALPRQQTLRATLDWGYDLLTDAERMVFRRLSVLVGGFSLDVAEAVCSASASSPEFARPAGERGETGLAASQPEAVVAPGEMLDLVSRLADKSLILMDRWHGVTRYRMLETVRDYGYERLVEAGEATATLDRYGAWILGRNPVSSTPTHRVDKIPPGRAAPEGEHPMVTVLVVDAVGFMPMTERLGEEETEAILRGCFAHMTDAVRRHEGTIARFLGDGFLALFGAPIAQKDSARRAVVAALEMQGALDAYADEVLRRLGLKCRFRIGLATGPVEVSKVGDDLALDYTAIGDAANLAARLQELGEPGAVYLSEQTYRAVRDHVACEPVGGLRVKGRAAPVVGYRAIREK